MHDDALLRQTLVGKRHSLTSVSQRAPVQPAAHEHEKLPGVSEQVAAFEHGGTAAAHSLTFVSQRAPVQPSGQLQVGGTTPAAHTPLFWHGHAAQRKSLRVSHAENGTWPAGHVDLHATQTRSEVYVAGTVSYVDPATHAVSKRHTVLADNVQRANW